MRKLLTGLVAAGLLMAAGCSSGTDPGSDAADASPAAGGAASGGTVVVFAAASLRSTFTKLGADFEATHPGTTVTFSFAGSSDLVTQIQGGAPADVFASADTATMDKLTADSLVAGPPVNFATNALTIAVPPDNPAKITGLTDLTRAGVQVVVCAPQVPCGAATEKVERAAGVTLTPVSEESSVTDVLNKVATGEADAGLVYVTDVSGSGGKVVAVDIPEASEAVTTYPIAPLAGSQHAELARDFVELVTSAEGQQVLADAGFGTP